MSASEEIKKSNNMKYKKLIPSIVINLILPWALYTLLHHIFTSEVIRLAITGTIPAFRTFIQWIWHKKVDYIGIIGVIGFIIALTVSVLSGGNPLPLKLVHPMIFGVIGIAFVASVVINKPLLMILYKVIVPGQKERFKSAIVRKKVTTMTLIFGGILLLSSIAHITLALILPTGIFLAINNLVSLITILTLIGSAKLIIPRIK